MTTIKLLTFVNIDGWNRPVFRLNNTKTYFGSVDKLFPYEEIEREVLKTVTVEDLQYFGSSFDCEPHGSDPLGADEYRIVPTTVSRKNNCI